MPTRTQNQSKSRRARNMAAVAPLTWGGGGGGTETKVYPAQSGNFQLYHNVPAVYYNQANLLDFLVQGTNGTQRIGNRVFIKSLQMRLVLNNKADRPNVSYRIVVCAAPATAGSDTFSELFGGGGFTGVHMPQNSLLLYDTVFPLNQGSSMENNVTPNKERSFSHVIDLAIDKPVVYNISDGQCATRIVSFVCAYDAYGTLTTDNIASVAQTTFRILFTDC